MKQIKMKQIKNNKNNKKYNIKIDFLFIVKLNYNVIESFYSFHKHKIKNV